MAGVIVDNTDDAVIRRATKALVDSLGLRYETRGENAGIAEAQNRGIRVAESLGYEYSLLLDQDSQVSPTLIEGLLVELITCRQFSTKVVAVGPNSYDHRDKLNLVPTTSRFGYSFRQDVPKEGRIPVPFLIASGTLIHIATWHKIGKFRTDYFIDHVDMEWGLRANLLGYQLLAISNLPMEHELANVHEMPDGTMIRTHGHSFRRYYQVRNYVLVQRDLRLPLGWRIGLSGKIIRAIASAIVRPAGRATSTKYALYGLRDGILNRRGKMT
ncbi:glycosyltransferase [Mycolicibacterium neoaurum]|uniref:glycosyltransferase n=1 Tax=Mycolicibacterium neoaurum TaxID=1795 RepID=UPI003B8A74C2